MVQDIISSILTNILKESENLYIETPSFLMNHLNFNLSDFILKLNQFQIQKSFIELPAFSDLIQNIYNFSNQNIYLKVSYSKNLNLTPLLFEKYVQVNS